VWLKRRGWGGKTRVLLLLLEVVVVCFFGEENLEIKYAIVFHVIVLS
jgi:hypothetical protein